MSVPEDAFEPRRAFETGAVRGTHGDDTRYDLISPIGLRRLARAYAEGAAKYGANNWLKGLPASNTLNHVIAHIEKWRAGESTGEDDLAHATWGLFALMHFEETRPELIDLPARQIQPVSNAYQLPQTNANP